MQMLMLLAEHYEHLHLHCIALHSSLARAFYKAMHWSSWTNTYAAQTNAYALVQVILRHTYTLQIPMPMHWSNTYAAQTNAYALVQTNAYV